MGKEDFCMLLNLKRFLCYSGFSGSLSPLLLLAAEVGHVFLLSESTGQPGTPSRDQSTTCTVALTQEIVVQMVTDNKRQKRQKNWFGLKPKYL